jgi:hypothetical protein
MNTISIKIGYWSSVLLTLSFIAWIVCFVGIVATSPMFIWTNLNDYLIYARNNNQFFQNIAKFFMLLFGLIYVLYINSLYDGADESKKGLARISLLFGTAFAILSSIHYFVQLSAVNMDILENQTAGLEHFVQANPHSIMTAIDMLGWTLFLGLSSLFIAPLFSGSRLNTIIRLGFITNGICCLLGAIAYLFQLDIVTFLCMNLGIGGAILTVAIASIKWFKNKEQQYFSVMR